MEYNTLVEKTLADDTLKSVVNGIVDAEESLLNLVTPDWKDVLENNVNYQNFASRKMQKTREIPKNHYVLQYLPPRDLMRIVMVGYFTISENQIICVNCPPLSQLGKAVFSDRPEVKVLDNHKFFVRHCGGYYCRSCKLAQDEFKYVPKAGQMEWCIDNTRVYNGINVVNMFRTTVLESFRQTVFPAIVSLTVDCRFVVVEDQTGKIGGKCLEMLLFKDSSLEPQKLLNMQNVVPPVPVVPEEQREQEDNRAAVLEEINPDNDSSQFLKTLGYGAGEESIECIPTVVGSKPNKEPLVGVEDKPVDCIPRFVKRMPDEEPLVDVEVKRVKMNY